LQNQSLFTCTRIVAPLFLVGSVILSGCSTTANDVRSSEPAPKMAHAKQDHKHDAGKQGAGAMQLPPGWTEADMQACMTAGQPGKNHEYLAKRAGSWTGTNTMWMAPSLPPTSVPTSCVITVEMDGRFAKAKYSGEMPGMGAFNGLGFYGFDNVSQKFVSAWLDNHSSGIMHGEGTLSPDGKTLTWSFKYNDPITKKQTTMREIETFKDDNTMTLEMHGTDPKSGQEYKMMLIELKRTGKAGT
jgi:hypothetical protein